MSEKTEITRIYTSKELKTGFRTPNFRAIIIDVEKTKDNPNGKKVVFGGSYMEFNRIHRDLGGMEFNKNDLFQIIEGLMKIYGEL
jgi:hypothetical protein